MADYVFIRLASLPLSRGQEEISWLLLDEKSEVRGGSGTLASIAGLAESRLTVVLIPGRAVLHTSARVPTRQSSKVRQAAPFLIEEQLAQDLEELHLAFGRQLDAELPISVTDRQNLADCCALFAEEGINPYMMVSESCCLREGELLIDGENFHMKALGHQLSGDLAHLPATLAGCTETPQQAENPAGISVLLDASADEAAAASLRGQLEAETGLEISPVRLTASIFETLCRHLDLSRAVNLLQGEFRAARPGRGMRAFRPVLFLSAAAVLLQTVMLVGQGLVFSMAGQNLDAEARAIYTEVFPDERIPRDLVRVWESKLRSGQAGQGSSLTDLLLLLNDQLDGTSLQLDSFSYSGQKAESVLQLRAAGSDELVTFSEALEGEGLRVTVNSIDQQEAGVRGSITVVEQGR